MDQIIATKLWVQAAAFLRALKSEMSAVKEKKKSICILVKKLFSTPSWPMSSYNRTVQWMHKDASNVGSGLSAVEGGGLSVQPF